MAHTIGWFKPLVAGDELPSCWGHTLCYYERPDGNNLVLHGGYGRGAANELYTVDPTSWLCQRRETTGEAPASRDSHTANIRGHQMVTFGGSDGARPSSEVCICDLRSLEWRRPEVQGAGPSPRESHSAALWGSQLVVFGGIGDAGPGPSGAPESDPLGLSLLRESGSELAASDSEPGPSNRRAYLNDVHVLDLETWHWDSWLGQVQGSVPAPRECHAAVMLGDRLVVYGGDCGAGYVGDVWTLDMKKRKWQQIQVRPGPEPGARAGHSAVAVGGCMLVLGGSAGRGVQLGDAWLLNLGPNQEFGLAENEAQWRLLPVSLPAGRQSHALAESGGRLFVLGGFVEDYERGEARAAVDFMVLDLVGHIQSQANIVLPEQLQQQLVLQPQLHSQPQTQPLLQPQPQKVGLPGAGTPGQALVTAPPSKPKPKSAPKKSHTGGTPKENWRHSRKSMLTSYNVFCAKRRTEIRLESPEVVYRELERRLGVEWAQMDADARRPFELQAAKENQVIAAKREEADRAAQAKQHSLEAAALALAEGSVIASRVLAAMANVGAEAVSAAPQPIEAKKERRGGLQQLVDAIVAPTATPSTIASPAGRPPPANGTPKRPASGMLQQPSADAKRLRFSQGPQAPGQLQAGVESSAAGQGGWVVQAPNPRLVGAAVQGTIDQVFDAGYMATVQVGGTTFRALLFSPHLALAPQQQPMTRQTVANPVESGPTLHGTSAPATAGVRGITEATGPRVQGRSGANPGFMI